MTASSSGGFTTPFLSFKLRKLNDEVSFLRFRHRSRFELLTGGKRRRRFRYSGEVRGDEDDDEEEARERIGCCCSCSSSSDSKKTNSDKYELEWRRTSTRFDLKKIVRSVRSQALPSLPFASRQLRFPSKPRCTRNSGPQSRDTPPKRDTGIANEKDWGINLLNENVNESGINEDGSTWYRDSGEELGENGYRCRWTRMGGQCQDGSSEWKETWWEKSDWTGYKELGVEKSGRNAEGDSWWETWQEMLHQDEWSNIARIERSAQKQAKSGSENAGWYEKWWEKYDAKGWTEKGAHKYGRLNEQSWWEKWGEHYDGRGSVLKWLL